MEYVAASIADREVGAGLEERPAIIRVEAREVAHAAAVVHVAEDVHRADADHGGSHARAGLVHVVPPNAHVAVAALGLDAVVVRLREHVAVDVGVVVREAGRGVVVLAADRIVIEIPVRRGDLVVAEHVVAAAVRERDALRAGRMAAIPAVRRVARIVDLVALDHDALEAEVVAARADAGIHVDTEGAVLARAARAAPAADVVIFDHDIMRTRLELDAIGAATLEREAAQDDVRRRDLHVVGRGVLHVNRGTRRIGLVDDVAARRAALRDDERRGARACGQRDHLADRERLAPGGDRESGARRLAGHAHLHFIRRARIEHHQAAAALVVVRVVPQVEALAERRVAALPEDHRATIGARVRRRRPVEADRFERRHAAGAVDGQPVDARHRRRRRRRDRRRWRG